MKDILLALSESQTSIVAAIQAVSNQVTAIRETLIFYYPEMEDDLKARLAVEQTKSDESLRLLLSQSAKMRESIRGLPS